MKPKMIVSKRDFVKELHILDEVKAEYIRAMKKFPEWPEDLSSKVLIIGEEFGEMTRAAVQAQFEDGGETIADVRKEAVQTMATLLRLILSIDKDEE